MPITLFLLFFLLHLLSATSSRHVITFRSPNLFPEGLTYDPNAQHFLVGSLHHRTISSVSDAGITQTLISDPSLPQNVTVLGLTVDPKRNRVLAAINSIPPLPPFSALASYDLHTTHRIFLSQFPYQNDAVPTVANDVAVDSNGNAYVTNSAGNYIWKVNLKGESSILSNSPRFTEHPVDRDPRYSFCGLNGIAYVNGGYLLVAQSNTGKLYKVDADDGTARVVILNRDLNCADGVAVRSDGVVLVVSPVKGKLWFLKSNDGWGEGVVFDEVDLDVEGFPTSIVVGGGDRVYVLYGTVEEGILGNSEREEFGIEEVRSPKEGEKENVWIYVMIGFGLVYFLYWRFQMGQLVKNLDKKIN